jgi:hypothetical protein
MREEEIPPNVGRSIGGYKDIDGYRFINIVVLFSQEKANEDPVDLGVVFAYDPKSEISGRRYVNFEENLSSPQSTHFIEVSGANTWHGMQWKKSTYIARFPVMGPYVQVFLYNRAPVPRNVTVLGYCVS